LTTFSAATGDSSPFMLRLKSTIAGVGMSSTPILHFS
jgi:hypothetical protein